MSMRRFQAVFLAMLLAAFLSACGQQRNVAPGAAAGSAGAKLKVVATTTLVGDVVRQVGGDAIDLTVLMQPGVDPHSFEFTPQDVTKVADSNVVFINGAGLEAFMSSLIQNASTNINVVDLSSGIKLLQFKDEHADEHEASTPAAAGEPDHEHESSNDPHVWWNPQNVAIWSDTIAKTLGEKDAANAETYKTNATAYKAKLQELDSWAANQVKSLPAANRKLVTDHDTFGYLADHYGFELVGAVLPNLSTQSEPSAQSLAQLQDAIKQYQVKAIFVGNTVNPALAQRVADDTGTKLVHTYTDSLGEPGSEAGTYLDFMRTSLTTIIDALK